MSESVIGSRGNYHDIVVTDETVVQVNNSLRPALVSVDYGGLVWPGLGTINVFLTCLSAQLTICAQK